ncbi:unnamed protein product [Eretmochelys imbricata]
MGLAPAEAMTSLESEGAAGDNTQPAPPQPSILGGLGPHDRPPGAPRRGRCRKGPWGHPSGTGPD